MYRRLERYRVSPELETVPTAAYACPAEQEGRHAQPSSCQTDRWLPAPAPTQVPTQVPTHVKVPKLQQTCLAIGAPPAWDREFGAIDFLTLLDLKLLSASARNRFLAPLTT